MHDSIQLNPLKLFQAEKKTNQVPVNQTKAEKQTIPSKSDEDLKRKQNVFQSDPDSFNGAQRENYSWTQSIKDIDVKIDVSLSEWLVGQHVLKVKPSFQGKKISAEGKRRHGQDRSATSSSRSQSE